MNCEVSELIEAQKDYMRWKKHVEEKRRLKNDPDIFTSYKKAAEGAKSLIKDFTEKPDSSHVTIFRADNGNFKIDAISDKDEYELHREEYAGKDVVAIVFLREGSPTVKQMREI